jgi:CTP synthase (UTP-ammonia lyase)
MITIGVIGDFDQSFAPHPATNAALEHSAMALTTRVDVRWLATEPLLSVPIAELEQFDGFLCAPGSPYQSLEGALRPIRLARERGWPLLGTCGGFQHIVIEFARSVLNFKDAQHAEYDPYSSTLFVTPLSCSLAGQMMHVNLVRDSRVAALYGGTQATERYYCDFGLNPDHQQEIDAAGLRVVGSDDTGEARVLEIAAHPFYMATLFVPQASSRPGKAHPLMQALVEAALQRAASRIRT